MLQTERRFLIVESPIMEPGLAAKFPDIRTWRGQGLDDPASSVRLDLTPAGFHAQVLGPEGTAYIDPYRAGDPLHVQSYWKRDLRRGRGDAFHCEFFRGPPITPVDSRAQRTTC